MIRLKYFLFVFVLVGVYGVDYSNFEDFHSHIPGHPPSLDQSPARNQLTAWSVNNSFSPLDRATTLHGVPVPSLTASQAIGKRGHVLLQDFHLIDKLGSFVRERIPERVVHARGAGAHGYFVVTHDVSKYTKAKFLTGIGKKTPVFVRFSTSVGETGTADTRIDQNGFATKFYTEDGNHDLVCNTIEVFMLRDAMSFTDQNHSRKRNPQTNLFDVNAWWDFVSLKPETTLHTLHLHSDVGRTDGYRRAHGYGVNTYKMVNVKGQIVFIKFHWRSLQTAPALSYERAVELQGTNPEYKTQDLYDAIGRKDYPKWNLSLQVMTIEQARKHPRNPFDPTRPWREEDYPLIPVGTMTLNRNPENYYAEVEQAAFTPANMVPGIEPSPDRVLSARLFVYQEAQRYRLGTNYAHLPINQPRGAPVTSYTRNGAACFGDNGGGSPNYYPNSFGGVEPDVDGARHASFSVEGIVDRQDIIEDEYIDARIYLEKDIDDEHRHRMVYTLAQRLKDVNKDIRERVYKNIFYPISKHFGDEVRQAVVKAQQADKEHELLDRFDPEPKFYFK